MANWVKLNLSKNTGQNRQADIWNVYVQVFTHLIVILFIVTVITLMNTNRYKSQAIVSEERKQVLEYQLSKSEDVLQKDNRQLKINLQKSLMDLQRQKLIIALDKVMESKTQELGLKKFPNSKFVKLKKTANDEDDGFQEFTVKAMELSNAEMKMKEKLYQELLKEANYQDNNYEVSYTSDKTKTELPADIKADDFFNTESILDANRAYIQNELIDKFGGLKTTIEELQEDVITNYIDNLYYDNKLSDKQIPDDLSETAKRNIFLAQVRDIKISLDKDLGYRFLPGTWEHLGITDTSKGIGTVDTLPPPPRL